MLENFKPAQVSPAVLGLSDCRAMLTGGLAKVQPNDKQPGRQAARQAGRQADKQAQHDMC